MNIFNKRNHILDREWDRERKGKRERESDRERKLNNDTEREEKVIYELCEGLYTEYTCKLQEYYISFKNMFSYARLSISLAR